MLFNRKRIVVAVLAATVGLFMLACAALYFALVNLVFWLAVGFGIVLLVDAFAGLGSRACSIRVRTRSWLSRLKLSLVNLIYSPFAGLWLAGMEQTNGLAFLVSIATGFTVSVFFPGFLTSLLVAIPAGFALHVLMGLGYALSLRRGMRMRPRFSVVVPFSI